MVNQENKSVNKGISADFAQSEIKNWTSNKIQTEDRPSFTLN